MKKNRFFYLTASFMRKDKAETLSKVDLTVMVDNGSSFLPLMKAIDTVRRQYPDTADFDTIQFDSYFEISKEDYDAYNKLKNYKTIHFEPEKKKD